MTAMTTKSSINVKPPSDGDNSRSERNGLLTEFIFFIRRVNCSGPAGLQKHTRVPGVWSVERAFGEVADHTLVAGCIDFSLDAATVNTPLTL